MQNWDRLLEQADIILNLLRPLRLSTKLSMYAQLNGTFEYNRTFMPPPRYQNPSSLQTSQQGHLGTTRPIRMVCISGYAAL